MNAPAAATHKTKLSLRLLKEASKFNKIIVWPFLPIFFIATALEYYFVPEHWELLFYSRLGVIGWGVLCIGLFHKKVINSYWMMALVLTAMGLHCSFFFLICGPDSLLQLNLAYFIYLASMGTFALFPSPQRMLAIGGTMLSALLFLGLNNAVSFEQWIFAGGVINLLGAPIAYFLAKSRIDFLRRDTEAKLQLEESQQVLDQKNKSLERVKEELERYSLKLESEVEKRTKSLKRSNQERDAMVYRLSHDFKSPMVNIRSLILLAQKERDPAKQDELFAMIDKSILKFERLVGGMDEFVVYALENEGAKPVDLKPLIQNTWQELMEQFPCEMDLEIAPGLPRSFVSQPAKLEMVFSTLLKNAIQFRRSDGQARVVVSSRQAGGVLHVAVQDNGKGIPDHLKSKVTELFFRGDSQSEGLGVGLYLAKGCVEQLGGSLEIPLTEEGTSIHLSLPLTVK